MTSKKRPAALIIDDASPANSMYFLHPETEHEFLIPNSFTRKFASVCRKNGMKGKFSVMPMPSQLGRIDDGLSYISKAHLKGFINTVKTNIMPYFDITPEILTHQVAYNIKEKKFMHIFEDDYIDQIDAEEIADYVSFSLKILKNAELHPTGITSPWSAGIKNEENYAKGISNAFYRVYRKKFAWYFLHMNDNSKSGQRPWVVNNDTKTNRIVVTVPGNTSDPFWLSQNPHTMKQAKNNVQVGVDSLLSNDGKQGRLRELFDEELPLTIVTHWQSLFSDGREIGLFGLEMLAKRINEAFADKIEWMTCSGIAKLVL